MKNITITLRQDVARWARIQAAEQGLSVSRMISDMLTERMGGQTEYEKAMRAWLKHKPQVLNETGAPYPKRDELYDRPVLRR